MNKSICCLCLGSLMIGCTSQTLIQEHQATSGTTLVDSNLKELIIKYDNTTYSNDSIDLNQLLGTEAYVLLNCPGNKLEVGVMEDEGLKIVSVDRFTKQVEELETILMDQYIDSLVYDHELYLIGTRETQAGTTFFITNTANKTEVYSATTDSLPKTDCFDNTISFVLSDGQKQSVNVYSLKSKEVRTLDEFVGQSVSAIGGNAEYLYVMLVDASKDNSLVQYNLLDNERIAEQWDGTVDYVNGNAEFVFMNEQDLISENAKIWDKKHRRYSWIAENEGEVLLGVEKCTDEGHYDAFTNRGVYHLMANGGLVDQQAEANELEQFYHDGDSYVFVDEGTAYFYEPMDLREERFEEYSYLLRKNSPESSVRFYNETGNFIYYDEYEPIDGQTGILTAWRFNKQDHSSESLGFMEGVFFRIYNSFEKGQRQVTIENLGDEEQEPIIVEVK